MDHIIRERKDLRGAELTCALIIANYASVDDKCYPGLDRIADDLRCTIRQTQVLIKRLEQKGVFKIISGDGRGNKTQFEFIKGEEINTLSTPKRVKKSTSFPEDKGRTFTQIKGEHLREKRVNICALPLDKDEPYLEPLIEPGIIPATEKLLGHEIDVWTVERIQEAVPDGYEKFWTDLIADRMIGNQGASRNFILTKLGYWIGDFKNNLWRFKKDLEEQNGSSKTSFRKQREQSDVDERNFFDNLRTEVDGSAGKLLEAGSPDRQRLV